MEEGLAVSPSLVLPLNQLVTSLAHSYRGEPQNSPDINIRKSLHVIHYKSIFRREAAPTSVPRQMEFISGSLRFLLNSKRSDIPVISSNAEGYVGV